MGKAGEGLVQVVINLVMSEEAPMGPVSKSEVGHANYANPTFNPYGKGKVTASETTISLKKTSIQRFLKDTKRACERATPTYPLRAVAHIWPTPSP